MTVDELAQCIADHQGNPGQIRQCEKDFVKAGGAESAPEDGKVFTDAGGHAGAQEDGKVFTDTTGGKVFVTTDGKVFDHRQ